MNIKKLMLYIFMSTAFYLISIYPMKQESQSIPEALAEIDAQKKVEKRKKRKTLKPLPEAIDFDIQYQKLLKRYREYEEDLDAYVKENPKASFGGINYAMTLKEMEQKLQEKFEDMNNRGLIIFKEEFERIKGKYFSRPTDDLTRIWGAEYLKNKINKSEYLKSHYDVPTYVIVADDPKHLEINLFFDKPTFPNAGTLGNAYIYFEKIVGPRVAFWHSPIVDEIGIKSGIGYNDFTDPGNIIEMNGKNYIVDTEFKSFKFPISLNQTLILDYAAKRFSYLNNNILKSTYIADL